MVTLSYKTEPHKSLAVAFSTAHGSSQYDDITRNLHGYGFITKQWLIIYILVSCFSTTGI